MANTVQSCEMGRQSQEKLKRIARKNIFFYIHSGEFFSFTQVNLKVSQDIIIINLDGM